MFLDNNNNKSIPPTMILPTLSKSGGPIARMDDIGINHLMFNIKFLEMMMENFQYELEDKHCATE